jgi:hypothetical protein
MQIVIGNLPPETSSADITTLLVEHLGAPEPVSVEIQEGLGERLLAVVIYPENSPAALGKVLSDKLNGLHYKARDLNATLAHSFKE